MTLSKVNSVAVGDIVCLRTDIEKVKELQKGHGEWIEIMKNVKLQSCVYFCHVRNVLVFGQIG